MTTPAAGDFPDLRAVRVVAYPFESDAVDISELVVTISWSEQADKAAIEGSLTLDNSADLAHKVLAPGTWLDVSMQDPETKRWGHICPMLYVWGRAFTDRYANTVNVTVFDVSSFLQREGEADYFFRKTKSHPRGWLASEIAETILFDLEIDARVTPTRYRIPYLMLRSSTPYEAIVKALMADKAVSGVRYRIRAGRFDPARGSMVDLDKIVISPAVQTNMTWVIKEGSNLMSLQWEESLDGKVTDVLGVGVSGNGREVRRVRVVSGDVRRYGRLRKNVMTAPRTSAAALERAIRQELVKRGDLKRTITVEAEGIPFMRAADSVYIEESGSRLRGTFFVTSVSHTISAGTHSMHVELDRVAQFPEAELSSDELKPEQVSSAGETVVARSGPTSSGVTYTGDYSWAYELAKRFGLTVTSTFRSPSQNAAVGGSANSYHMQWGRAADLSGSASAMMALARWASQHLDQFTEVYYDPLGGWKNGISIGPIGGHSDHVHLTISESATARAPSSRPTRTRAIRIAPLGGSAGVPPDEWVFAPGQISNIDSSGGRFGSGVTADIVGSSSYPGDNAGPQAIARWMGAAAQKYGLPPELPVMAALAESGLKNHAPYPDGGPSYDDLAMGFFSIHPSRARSNGYDWEQMRRRPQLQIEWFIGEANKIKSRWASKGPSGYPGWIQDIEKSANPTGSQYAAQYSRARSLLGIG